MDIKSIELFNKTVFTWVTMEQLVQMPTPMPENEAGFIYVLNGNCVNYSETEQLNIVANQGVLAKSGNSTFRTLPYKGNTKFSAISIRFHKDILENIYKETSYPFYKKSNYSLTTNSVTVASNELITQYIQSLLSYFNNQESITDELLILKLKELIALLLQTDNAPEILEIMGNLFETKTFEFKEVIKAHIFSSIGIEELAQLTYHSLSSFKKEFKRIYDNTPNNYIIDKRIEKVAELLPNSKDTISNIAYDCKFKTLAHMSRVFKVKYGISPTEYKRNLSDKQ